MNKKIYDIRPPKLSLEIKDVEKSDKISIPDDGSRKEAVLKTGKRSPYGEIFAGVFIVLILFVIYFYNSLPKSDIIIWPNLHQMTAEEKITAEKSVISADLTGGIIPAKYMEQEIEESREFQSTGIFENKKKSAGTIRVYNNLEPLSPFTLIKGTQFLSDLGRSFRALEKIVIPAASYQKGRLQPGFVDAKVEAVEAGEEYDIGPSKFSVPKLSGSIYFYGIYAESNNRMSGGYAGQSKKTTKEDIENAKNFLTSELLARAESILRKNLSDSDVLPENAILKIVVGFNSEAEPEKTADNFTANAKVKVSALVFNKDDVKNFAEKYFYAKLSDGKSLLKESVSTSYIPETIDIKGGKITINLKMSASEYQSIDKIYLIDLFAGKSINEMRDVAKLLYGDEVAKIEINFWPFWVNKSPRNQDRIKIDMSFN